VHITKQLIAIFLLFIPVQKYDAGLDLLLTAAP